MPVGLAVAAGVAEGSYVGSGVNGELGKNDGSLEGEDMGAPLGYLEELGLGLETAKDPPSPGSTLRDQMSTNLLK